MNVNHIIAESQGDNIKRSEKAITTIRFKQTNCIKGHPFDKKNTIILKTGEGKLRGRSCRMCANKRSREFWHAHYVPVPPITHCIRGHKYNKENTVIKKNGTRSCRKCVKFWSREKASRNIHMDNDNSGKVMCCPNDKRPYTLTDEWKRVTCKWCRKKNNNKSPKGHKLTIDNMYIYHYKTGKRIICRTCRLNDGKIRNRNSNL